MAKGQQSKELFYNKILEIFNEAFIYNGGKEIRIPFKEDGKDIQLKIVTTCAKDNVEPGGDNILPGTKVTIKEGEEPVFEKVKIEVSDEEKKNLADLMSALNL